MLLKVISTCRQTSSAVQEIQLCDSNFFSAIHHNSNVITKQCSSEHLFALGLCKLIWMLENYSACSSQAWQHPGCIQPSHSCYALPAAKQSHHPADQLKLDPLWQPRPQDLHGEHPHSVCKVDICQCGCVLEKKVLEIMLDYNKTHGSDNSLHI